jgi:hypothetical protein
MDVLVLKLLRRRPVVVVMADNEVLPASSSSVKPTSLARLSSSRVVPYQ